jgi:hypothetical protein
LFEDGILIVLGGCQLVPGVSKMGKSLYVSPEMEKVREEIRKARGDRRTGGGAQL